MNKSEEFDSLTHRVIGCAIEVHRELGPGLLESAYKACFVHERVAGNCRCQVEVPVGISYKGMAGECGYRMDLGVEERLVVEMKSVEALSSIHDAQLLTCLRLSGLRTGC